MQLYWCWIYLQNLVTCPNSSLSLFMDHKVKVGLTLTLSFLLLFQDELENCSSSPTSFSRPKLSSFSALWKTLHVEFLNASLVLLN